jgi:hypothetical protein
VHFDYSDDSKWWHEQGDNQACVPYSLRVVAFAQSPPYFFPVFGFVWASALPATDLVFAPVRSLRSKSDALLATERDVCFVFTLAIVATSFLSAWVLAHKLTNMVRFVYINKL